MEFALVSLLLFGLIFGAVEAGFAFRDWLSITSASREGARVGSAAGNADGADCFILDALSGSLLTVDLEDIEDVYIFKANSDGSMSTERQHYKVAGDTPADLLVCNEGWDRQAGSNWPPTDRSVVAGDLDLLGIRIVFSHDWITNVGPFGGTTTWVDDAVMRLEPKTFVP